MDNLAVTDAGRPGPATARVGSRAGAADRAGEGEGEDRQDAASFDALLDPRQPPDPAVPPVAAAWVAAPPLPTLAMPVDLAAAGTVDAPAGAGRAVAMAPVDAGGPPLPAGTPTMSAAGLPEADPPGADAPGDAVPALHGDSASHAPAAADATATPAAGEDAAPAAGAPDPGAPGPERSADAPVPVDASTGDGATPDDSAGQHGDDSDATPRKQAAPAEAQAAAGQGGDDPIALPVAARGEAGPVLRGADTSAGPADGHHPRRDADPGRPAGSHVAEAAARSPARPMELVLAPEELGRVRMAFHNTDGALTLSVAADRAETLDLMRRNIEGLARDLRALGFESVAFDFGQGRHAQPHAPAPDRPAGHDPSAPADVAAPASAPPTPPAHPGGLDIRL